MKQWKYWKNLPVCKVSDQGDCYDLHSNGECKHEYIQGHDYVWIYMFSGYKRFLLAKVVADTWLDNPNHYQFVRHKDGDSLNNCVDNLEFVASMEDTIDHSSDAINIELWKEKLKKQHSAFSEI